MEQTAPPSFELRDEHKNIYKRGGVEKKNKRNKTKHITQKGVPKGGSSEGKIYPSSYKQVKYQVSQIF